VTGAAIRFRDDPWARLPCLVPLALALTLLSQMGFLALLRQPGPRTGIPRPLHVQVVELPVAGPPAAARPAPRTPPARRAPPIPRPRIESPAPRPAAPPTEARIAPPDSTPPTAEEPAPQGSPAPATAPAPPSTPSTPAPSTAEGPPTQAPVAAVPPSSQGAPGGTGNMSARAIYKPMPEVPEALRRNPIELLAVARFRVAANGAAQVELIESTGDPNLNRALLEALARWRFFPAMQGGKPVASTIDVRIPISVK
jgi:periplasmic protein TonB